VLTDEEVDCKLLAELPGKVRRLFGKVDHRVGHQREDGCPGGIVHRVRWLEPALGGTRVFTS
jgi:hypothetical protein